MKNAHKKPHTKNPHPKRITFVVGKRIDFEKQDNV
jgi:hypothetical protein